MKVTRIDIEGPNGTATITRDGWEIRVDGRRLVKAVEAKDGRTALVSEGFQLLGDARDTEANGKVARILQTTLDGYRGTKGDVADYLRAIRNFED
jgi:RNase P/RNase MRP subunit p29